VGIHKSCPTIGSMDFKEWLEIHGKDCSKIFYYIGTTSGQKSVKNGRIFCSKMIAKDATLFKMRQEGQTVRIIRTYEFVGVDNWDAQISAYRTENLLIVSVLTNN
jgi:hypothetical protein